MTSNTLKFLGTAGARFVVTRQLRASGGMWLSLDGTNLLIDPGPGSLVRCLASRPALDPKTLDGIILTHRHIDHANDINIMIEAMTNGGFSPKGTVFAPADALDDDPVILQHFRNHVDRIDTFKEGGTYALGSLSFATPKRLKHGVETYGLNVQGKKGTISIITDTEYFDELGSYFKGEILVINVVRLEEKDGIPHLCLADAEAIIRENKPALSILTHFGMTMIRAKPWELAKRMSENLGVEVIAARDGMTVNLDDYFK